MDKIFNLVAIDDQPDTLEHTLNAVKAILELEGYKIQYKILSKQSELEQLKTFPSDIVMFDCSLSGGQFDFSGDEEARFGLTLLKNYRKMNKRTKIIFYSGSFVFEGEGNFDLTALDFVKIINELNIFAISNREVDRLCCTIKKAIESLDTVLIGMEDLIFNYGENGRFYIEGTPYTAKDLLKELRSGSEVGEKFRLELSLTIMTYLMKFGDDTEK